MLARPAVWHVSDCFSGGVATHLAQLRRLTPEAEHVVVRLGDNYDAHLMRGPADVALPFSRKNPATWRPAARRLAELAPDGALLHGHSTLGGWVAALAARRRAKAGRAVRLAYTPHAHFLMRHGRAVENALLRPFERRLFRGLPFTAVAAGSQELAILRRLHPFADVRLIRHGTALRPRAGRKEAEVDVAFVGRLEGQKDPEHAARVLARTRLSGILVGSGSLAPKVRAALGSAGSRVRLVDRVDDVEGLLASARMLLVTSRYEVGIPYVVLEALAVGCLAVVRQAPGLDEAIALDCAVALPEGEAEAAAALERLAASGAPPKPLPPELSEQAMRDAYLRLYGEA